MTEPARPCAAIIEALDLSPHPEGGHYRETYRGADDRSGRSRATAILFLLETGQRSHWHRVDADELWIWQCGDPLVLQIALSGERTGKQVILGTDLLHRQAPQGMVPAGAWQAAHPLPRNAAAGYSLVSCVVSPGFEFAGFTLAPPGWHPGDDRRGEIPE
ncbi:cupin domain-containing protein [Erythrobacter sp.]|uniref:cupin domain-containing protein n=1 Tax=Erythrobacter sp. TaxID=1042 RepID=UPI003C76200C